MKPLRTLALLIVFIVAIAIGGAWLNNHHQAATSTPTDTTTSNAAISTDSPLTASPQAASASPLTGSASSSVSPLPTASATVQLPDAQKVAQPTIKAGDVTPVSLDGVDMTDADAVADLFAKTAATSDTTTDTSWLDAMRRARSLMTDELSRQTMAQIPGGQDSDWLELEAHHGHTEAKVTASADDLPADSKTTAYRVRIATRTSVGDGGWKGSTVQTSYFLTLTMTDGQWRVSQVQTSDYAG